MTTQTQDWVRDGKPFHGEADLEHPWAERYRLPIIRTFSPRWKYELAFMTSDDIWPNIDWSWPTEDEARVLAWYLEDVKMGYYNARWKAGMRERPLDVDGSTQTLIFAKVGNAWVFRKTTWQYGATFVPSGHRGAMRRIGQKDDIGGPYIGRNGLIRLIQERIGVPFWATNPTPPACSIDPADHVAYVP